MRSPLRFNKYGQGAKEKNRLPDRFRSGAKKITQTYADNDQVKFIAVQTVFEGHRFNTPDKLRQNQVKYSLKIPMAHAAGNPDSHQAPPIMRAYRSGGTPWTVIIDPGGIVVYNGFHVEADQAEDIIDRLIRR